MAIAETQTRAPSVREHLLLPESDGTIVQNFREHPQSLLLTDSILPVLRRRHPDGQFAIGQDSGIYWKKTDPPLRGCKSPDWYYIPNVPPQLEGQYRRSYVLWDEGIPPAIILEFASGDGSEERDRTPWSGKFWIYEQIIRPPFYGIFDVQTGNLVVFHHVDGTYQALAPNDRGHYPITTLGVELGVWDGYYVNEHAPWMRWWDDQGRLILTNEERAETERQRAETEHQRAEAAYSEVERERRRAEALAARLRELGINPDAV
jgi:Uma2 family endonuclease